MKFLCPGPTTKARAEELWMMTFADREKYRKNREFHEYMKQFPVASAFQGLMVSEKKYRKCYVYHFHCSNFLLKVTLDFGKMYPDAQNFCQQFLIIQPKILAKYDDLLPNIQNGKSVQSFEVFHII